MRLGKFFPSIDLHHLPRRVKESAFLSKIFPKHARRDAAQEGQGDAATRTQPPLLHVEGARRNARASVERVIEQGQASSRPVQEEGHLTGETSERNARDVLRLSHLAARIADFLPPREQRMLVHQTTSGSFGRTQGPSPRFDITREMPANQKEAFLASPVMARAVLDEAMAGESEAEGALGVSRLVRDMPNAQLKMKALNFVSSRLHASLRHQQPLHPDFGQIVLNIATVLGEGRLRRPEFSNALSLVESNLHYLERAELRDTLGHLLAGGQAMDLSMKEKVTSLVERHIGRLPPDCLLPVLNGVAELMETRGVMLHGSRGHAKHQQRLAALLRARLPSLAEPNERSQPLIRFARITYLSPAAETLLLGMIGNVLSHCSSNDTGELMIGLASGFQLRYRDSFDTQSEVTALLERHLPHVSQEHAGRALEHLPAAFGDDGRLRRIFPEIKARVFGLIQDQFDRAPVGSKAQTLLELAKLLKAGAFDPQSTAILFQFIAAKLPQDVNSLGDHQEIGEKTIATIAKGLGAMDDLTQSLALVFIGQRLPSMSGTGRINALSAIVTHGLNNAANRQNALNVLHTHLPGVLSMQQAIPLSMNILTPEYVHLFPPAIQNQAAGLLVQHVDALTEQEKLGALRCLSHAFSGAIDLQVQDRAITLYETHLPDLPLRSKGQLLEYLTEHLGWPGGSMADRAVAVVCGNLSDMTNDMDGHLARSFAHLAAQLSSPELSVENKRQILDAISTNSALLVPTVRDYYQRFTVEKMIRAVGDEHFNPEMARPVLDLVKQFLSACPNTPETRIVLRTALGSLPHNNPHRQEVRQILIDYGLPMTMML